MKLERSSSKSGLFLMELIIAIVFFAVSSAVSIQLFVKAHLISARSADISAASVIANNYAEVYKMQSVDKIPGMSSYLSFFETESQMVDEETTLYLYFGYDDSRRLRQLTEDHDVLYTMRVVREDDFAALQTARLSVYRYQEGALPGDGDEALFAIDVKRYSGEV